MKVAVETVEFDGKIYINTVDLLNAFEDLSKFYEGKAADINHVLDIISKAIKDAMSVP